MINTTSNHERAKRLVTKPSVISEAKKHLSAVLVSNGHPLSFFLSYWNVPRSENHTTVLNSVKGLSERLRRCLQQGVRAVFKSETALRSHLARPKDAVESTKQDGVVYKIPSECGKSTLARLANPYRTQLRNIIKTSDQPAPRPPSFQSTPTTLDITHSGTN